MTSVADLLKKFENSQMANVDIEYCSVDQEFTVSLNYLNELGDLVESSASALIISEAVVQIEKNLNL